MLALVVIARNEARSIVRCLESVRPWVDEMLVVDTGSTDDTAERACAAGARVLDFTWVDDFSAARNFALAQTDAEWRLVLDADEWLIGGGEVLQALRGSTPGSDRATPGEQFVGLVEVCSEIDEGGTVLIAPSWLPRVLPHGVAYRGRIHEQPDHRLPLRSLPVRVGHDGYRAAQWQHKRERNRVLLERELVERAGDPYVHYQIGKDARMRGDPEAACASYAKARALLGCDSAIDDDARALRERTPWLRALVVAELESLGAAGHFEQAIDRAQAEMSHCDDSPDFHFVLGNVLLDFALAENQRASELLPMIEACWRKALEIGDAPCISGTVEGRGSYLAAHNLAAFCASQGRDDEARYFTALEHDLRARTLVTA